MTSRLTKVASVTLFAAMISISAGVAYASEVTGSLSTGPISEIVSGSQISGTLAGNIAVANSGKVALVSSPSSSSRSGGHSRSVTSSGSAASVPADNSTFISFAGTVGSPEFTSPSAYAGTELASANTASVNNEDQSIATASPTEELTEVAVADNPENTNLAAVGALGAINWGTWIMILVGLVAIGGIAYGVNRLIV